MSEWQKHDTGKLRFDLIPERALNEVVAALTHGATKYGDDNWRSCQEADRYFAAAQRHLWAWKAGERSDPETKLSHLSHAICCLMFLDELTR